MNELTALPPYVNKRKWWHIFTPVYTLPQESDQDQVRIRELTGHVLAWCRQHDLITYTESSPGDFSVLPKVSVNTMGFSNIINTWNLRRLVYDADLEEFIRLISDSPSYTHMTDIQQLLIELIATHESYTIDLVVNKTYRAFDVLPTPDADYTWEMLHGSYPFLWLILFIQTTIRRYSEM